MTTQIKYPFAILPSGNVRTCEFRVVGPLALFNPRTDKKPGSEPKYILRALFPKGADLSVIQKDVERVAKEKWGEKVNMKGLRLPFHDQGEKDYEGFEDGAIFITVNSKVKPGLIDARGAPITDEVDFYAGCWARASLRTYAYDRTDGKGVTFDLANVQKIRDDEPLGGGRTRPENDFEPIDEPAAETTGDGMFE